VAELIPKDYTEAVRYLYSIATVIYRREQPIPHDAETAFDWHARDGAIERLLPPWQNVRVGKTTGGLADPGSEVELVASFGPFWKRVRARHIDYRAGRSFSDELVKGPFPRWVHVHAVEPEGEASRLVDTVDFELPLGPVGRLASPLALRELERMFAFRQGRVADDLARHARYADRSGMRVGVTGQSGLIGTRLAAYLRTGGHEVVPLVRRPAKPDEISWDPAAGVLDPADLEGLDAIVHLAGESVSGRWTAKRRQAILQSRVDGLRVLRSAMGASKDGPRILLAASAIGWYGADRGDEELDETSAAGSGFLAGVCSSAEDELRRASADGIRTVPMRLGIVLHPQGGALRRLLPPARLGLGGPVGSGRGWWSWIDLEDVLGAVEHLLHSGLEGPVNVVAPAPVQQREFARTLGRVLRRPSFMPLPAVAVRTIFGEMGREVLLASQRVRPARLEEDGFGFLRPELENSLRAMLGRGCESR
jgi:uncharacterized protein (TIGR01777 family)